MNWGGMLLGGIAMLLFWIIILAFLFLGVRWLIQNARSANGGSVPDSRKGDALEILKERYARGEITREQYQDMRRDLET